MKVPRAQLAEIIGERTLKQHDTKVLARAIAAYLLSENRVDELESLIRDVLAYREAHGIIEVTALTAHDLGRSIDQEVSELIKQHYPDAKQVTVHEEYDASVIGGIKVQLANEQLDMSVRAKLDTFKRLTIKGSM